jgi:hypothetical protein
MPCAELRPRKLGTKWAVWPGGTGKEQLRQRTSSIGRLSPLTLRKIGENGKGVPRNINPLCFNAMLLGFADAPSQSLTPRIRRDAHA